MRILFIVFICSSAVCHGSQQWALCEAHEKLVFGCVTGKKVASICASPDVTSTTGYVQYRYGTVGRLELVYPDHRKPPKGHFFFSRTDYSGGEENRIRFNNDGYDYVVFNNTVRTNFKAGEPNNPQESAGIFTRRTGKTSRPRKCDDFVGVGEIAVKYFDKEEYDARIAP